MTGRRPERMALLLAPSIGKTARLVALGLALCSAGCASLPAGHPAAGDPFERLNRSVYTFNTKLDRAVVRPLARTSRKLPAGLSRAVHNFFDNLLYPVTIVNDLLQGNGRDGARDVARLVLNTTVGIGGLFDPATGAGLDLNYQDFGITLGKWGVPKGPYLILPLVGPSTVRDAGASIPGLYAYLIVPGPAIGIGILGMSAVDNRAELLLLPADRLVENAYDPYALQRSVYWQHRDFQVGASPKPMVQAEDPPRH
jgi:phospholipid-binding lipoprotein MlaA